MDRWLLAGVVVAMAGMARGADAQQTPAALQITTTKCPGGVQGQAYAGCAVAATGGAPPYKFSYDTTDNYPPPPEGLSLNAASGVS